MNKSKKIEIQLPIILLIIILIICSLKIFSLATDKETKTERIYDNTINDNNINSSKIVQTEQNIIEETLIVPFNNEATEEETSENNVSKNDVKSDDSGKQQKDEKNQKKNQTKVTSSKKSKSKGYTTIGTVKIPSLGIKYKIYSKTTYALLKKSVTKFWGPEPNEEGNLCIVGHNYKTSKFFGKLPKIKKGAKVYITDKSGRTLTYKVYKTKVIKEDDLECTSQKTNGNTEITLITCYYEPGHKHATKRFIVKARAE